VDSDDKTIRKIEDAVNRLKAAGTKITLKAVRNELKGGSYATIQPVLKAWRDRELAKAPTGTSREILRYLDLDGLVAHVRAQAVADCAQKMDEVERESAEAQFRNDELEKQCAAQRKDLDLAASRLQDVTGQLMATEHRAATQHSEILLLKENDARLREELYRLGEVAREKAALEQTLHAYESRHHDQQQEIARLTANTDGLRAELVKRIEHGAALEATLTHLEKQKAEQQETIFHLQELLAARA